MKVLRLIPLLVLLLAGCVSDDFSDLDSYMAEMRNKPRGTIDPIPTFVPYRAFTYAAQALRAPFDPPVQVADIVTASGPEVKPDLERSKEYLERFSIESISMVGSLEQGGQLWALVTDAEQGVHRVRVGNYLGKDHGQIVEATENSLAVLEIVPNGIGGWIERPRSLELQEQN